ncbi:hypothetical protein [Streptomyces sp. NPDC086010]|uniref:hypothetical protein n=1 Tax=Streptomyces sp. NPDC086010 TaxID=3365745 RepID=UPI0037D4DE42
MGVVGSVLDGDRPWITWSMGVPLFPAVRPDAVIPSTVPVSNASALPAVPVLPPLGSG